MTTLQKAILTLSAVLAAGTALYQAHENKVLSQRLVSSEARIAPLSNQIMALKRDRAEAVSQLERANSRLLQQDNTTAELNRLRSELASQRADGRDTIPFSKGELPSNAEAVIHSRKIGFIKQKLEQMPEKKIPELALLTEEDWVAAANKAGKLESDSEIRHAFTELRFAAKSRFAPLMMAALEKYAAAHEGYLPPDTLDLSPYFEKPLPEGVLQRYQVMCQGKLADFQRENLAITEKRVVDEQEDTLFQFGQGSYRTSNQSNPMAGEPMVRALEGFRKANNGQLPKSYAELTPFWKN